MSLRTTINSFFGVGNQTATLAAPPSMEQEIAKRVLAWKTRTTSSSRQTIATWTAAQKLFEAEEPKNFAIQNLYDDILKDAFTFSQIQIRQQQSISSNFRLLKPNGDVDEEATKKLRDSKAYRAYDSAINDSIYRGYRLTESALVKNAKGEFDLQVSLIPNRNVVPQIGAFYADLDKDKFIPYRQLPEFGTYVLEFNSKDIGLINKAVPHVIFKRFAQSAWVELCEIYGIPPRVMKTNTQDPSALARSEAMMRDMGSAAWFIIDDNESFEWATGVSTNGDVYQNLMRVCYQEIALLFNGAIMGQDTKNGNYSKEKAGQELQWLLVQSDMETKAEYWNTLILPAMQKLGFLKGELTFEYEPAEDLEQLWTRTSEALQYYEIDPEWVKDKFGIEITAERQPVRLSGVEAPTKPKDKTLSFESFFD